MDALTLILQYITSASFFKAAMFTLFLTIMAVLLGILFGLIVAIAQESKIKLLQPFVVGYLWLFRGTPVLFQIIFIYNVLPQFGILLSGFTCAILALSLNESAYMSEILRSGLQAVGRGQRMAGRALGMRDSQVMTHVVLPQALRIVIPPIGNQFIGMLKTSALVSVIAVEELLLVANQTASANFRYLEALSAAGIYYLIFTTIFMMLQSRIEVWARGKRGRRGRGARAAGSETQKAAVGSAS
ncbi:MAG: ABC transporter permease subunit [Rhizobiales bacterium]|nr:ABC transporter permease subunit [Hyphomicrobiales bacterium]